ncbi:uncharacterized protein JCM15063_002696 [Sporobolomyces koalae]|uniref:uncharacterized protein n=1 Tax=Sporobolomyces koalae TaxID=500713 RepID=UPI0031755572
MNDAAKKRGRKLNDELPPSRSRDVQRAFRARRAAHLANLEARNSWLEQEVEALRARVGLFSGQYATGPPPREIEPDYDGVSEVGRVRGSNRRTLKGAARKGKLGTDDSVETLDWMDNFAASGSGSTHDSGNEFHRQHHSPHVSTDAPFALPTLHDDSPPSRSPQSLPDEGPLFPLPQTASPPSYGVYFVPKGSEQASYVGTTTMPPAFNQDLPAPPRPTASSSFSPTGSHHVHNNALAFAPIASPDSFSSVTSSTASMRLTATPPMGSQQGSYQANPRDEAKRTFSMFHRAISRTFGKGLDAHGTYLPSPSRSNSWPCTSKDPEPNPLQSSSSSSSLSPQQPPLPVIRLPRFSSGLPGVATSTSPASTDTYLHITKVFEYFAPFLLSQHSSSATTSAAASSGSGSGSGAHSGSIPLPPRLDPQQLANLLHAQEQRPITTDPNSFDFAQPPTCLFLPAMSSAGSNALHGVSPSLARKEIYLFSDATLSVLQTEKHLNFYRLHLTFFTLVPLVASAIFYASNGPRPENQIAFVDCVFMCYSAMTACGLATVLFLDLTVWQQVILFILTTVGSLSFVSIVVILVRRRFFRKRFRHLLAHSPVVRQRVKALAKTPRASETVEKPTRRIVRFPGATHLNTPVDHQQQREMISASPDAGHNDSIGTPNHRVPLARTRSMQSESSPQAIREDFGGFPNPVTIATTYLASLVRKIVVDRSRRDEHFPRTSTLISTRSGNAPAVNAVGDSRTGLARKVSYISFNTEVGRNSKFLRLTSEQQEEIGGVEYRALSLLLKIVIGYWLFLQLVAVVTIAPWLTYSKTYQNVFGPRDARKINPTWFSFFLVFSAFGNNGMSVVDDSMVPFQKAYWLLIVTAILVLAGNTALPVFLRFTIWFASKLVPRASRAQETLQFLLDHPRRCYIYLFPAHQTWFLVFLLILFNGIDWLFFWVLDIGNPLVDALSPGVRCIDGLFQALAVRTAGFAIVNLGAVAPALQFTFAVMMYISAYPIAVSVRSTNVYEDQSVGVHETEDDEDEFEASFQQDDRPPSAYILSHVRRQLSFDIGFLTLAVFLLCVFERHRIGSQDWSEVSIFSLMFEILSAYGCVGLSLGNNLNSASLSNVLRTLSKLVLVATMVRGRHRGLPVRIDRSIMLPSEFETAGEGNDEYEVE